MRARLGKGPIPASYFEQTQNGQDMYGADIERLEVLSVERGADGLIVRETRVPVDPKVLVS
jgi:hypothetical protein